MDYSTDTVPLRRSDLLIAGLILIGCGFVIGVIFVAAILWVFS